MSDDTKIMVTYNVTMEATSANFHKLRCIVERDFDKAWKITYSLNHNPQIGEVWRDGIGDMYVLRKGHNPSFPLGIEGSCRTWTEMGAYDPLAGDNGRQYPFNVKNLVERVLPQLDIKPGQYWTDRLGNIHRISEVSTDSLDPMPVKTSVGLMNMKWRLDGHYVGNEESQFDLVARVEVSTV